ncbi:hypothetical protein [Plastoroseomonas arctica]|uniref:Uncharacterized protein n=1 Tax=Plastoroseomonas arctica TaxID=1509237 RepID=A0AAF1JV89_9PROT|nr:hypothetical protein [Plastoroseomonas arctica]MBR0654442.1 hypothetical protein [Plastoroseomonas arctica]
MIRMTMFFLALAAPLAAQTQPEAGGRQPDHPGARDVGPATQPPRTESPQTVNRGTDGAAAGQQLPGATGVTPQGMMGTSTAGERAPNAPVGGQPPQSAPAR